MSPRKRSDEKARVILAAAQKCLADKGYSGTTISEVAAEAGVSRGLLHYYFKNKEDMLAQVVQASIEPSLKIVGPLLSQSRSSSEMASSLTRAIRLLVERDPTSFFLIFECWGVARQSETVAHELSSMFRRFRSAMEVGLVEAKSQGIIFPRIPIEKLAILLTGLIDGLALQMMIEPSLIKEETIWNALEASIELLMRGES